MKAKITFKEAKISMNIEIDSMGAYTISFGLDNKYHNPITYQLLYHLGASVSKMSDGSLYVCISKKNVDIEFI